MSAAAQKHPVSCASMSRPVGKAGKRRELWTAPMPMLCDCPIGEEQRKKERQLREAAPALANALEAMARHARLLERAAKPGEVPYVTARAVYEPAETALRAAGRVP